MPATRNPIIIALTASVFEVDKDTVLAGGCDDFVRKPFRVDEIFVKMAQYLEVRYIYQDLQTPEEKPVTPALTSADLAGFPEDLVQRINTAAKGAMSKELLNLLQQISPDFIPVADAMVDLISQYQFSKIIALTEKENKDSSSAWEIPGRSVSTFVSSLPPTGTLPGPLQRANFVKIYTTALTFFPLPFRR